MSTVRRAPTGGYFTTSPSMRSAVLSATVPASTRPAARPRCAVTNADVADVVLDLAHGRLPAAGAVPVHRARLGHQRHLEARGVQPTAEIGLLEVHAKAFVEATDPHERVAADQHGGARHGLHRGRADRTRGPRSRSAAPPRSTAPARARRASRPWRSPGRAAAWPRAAGGRRDTRARDRPAPRPACAPGTRAGSRARPARGRRRRSGRR